VYDSTKYSNNGHRAKYYMKNRITAPGLVAMNQKVHCQFCNKETTVGNIKRHEVSCYLNPTVMVECKVCSKAIKDYKHSKGTCSYSCSNKLFRSGYSNGNWKGENYRNIAKIHHEMRCIICGEDKIVAIHHLDENHDNNAPNNLVPLCPTHHQYLHSRYKNEILPKVTEYINKFILGFA
jgi:hypothetical protein